MPPRAPRSLTTATTSFLLRPTRRQPPQLFTPHHRPLTTTTTTVPTHQPQRPSTQPHRHQPPHHRTKTTSPPSSTPYTLFPTTFPSGPPPISPFTPPIRALRTEYLRLQAQHHPDLVPPAQKSRAEAQSAALNAAYKLLLDPLSRAGWLLEQEGIDIGDEGASLGGSGTEASAAGAGQDMAFLAEVMQIREELDEAESAEEVARLKEENDQRIAASVGVLEGRFAKREVVEAGREAVRLRYWRSVAESIEGWEEGRGGGRLQH